MGGAVRGCFLATDGSMPVMKMKEGRFYGWARRSRGMALLFASCAGAALLAWVPGPPEPPATRPVEGAGDERKALDEKMDAERNAFEEKLQAELNAFSAGWATQRQEVLSSLEGKSPEERESLLLEFEARESRARRAFEMRQREQKRIFDMQQFEQRRAFERTRGKEDRRGS